MKHARESLHRVMMAAVLCGLILLPPTTSGSKEKNLEGFAKCLAAKKATMYGSFWCRHCDDQKALFGSSFRYVPYVECSTPGVRQLTFSCQVMGIRYTPTWIFADGDRRLGLQPLEKLSQKTGCPLP